MKNALKSLAPVLIALAATAAQAVEVKALVCRSADGSRSFLLKKSQGYGWTGYTATFDIKTETSSQGQTTQVKTSTVIEGLSCEFDKSDSTIFKCQFGGYGAYGYTGEPIPNDPGAHTMGYSTGLPSDYLVESMVGTRGGNGPYTQIRGLTAEATSGYPGTRTPKYLEYEFGPGTCHVFN